MLHDLNAGLGDLSDFLGPPTPANLEILHTTNDPKLQKLSNEWANRPDGKKTLINNNEYLREIAEKKASTKKENNISEIINKARYMMMNHNSPLEVDQYLKYRDESISVDNYNKIYSESGLLGNVYLDRNIVTSCNDLRKLIKNPRTKSAVFLIMASECKSCNDIHNGICPVVGRKLISNIPDSERQLKEARERLKTAGKITSNKIITTWDQLRDVLLEKQDDVINKRQYSHYSPVSPVKSELNFNAAIGELNNASSTQKNIEKENIQKQKKEIIGKPIARQVQEFVLKGVSRDIYKQTLLAKQYDKDFVLMACNTLGKDPLLQTSLIGYPRLYDNCMDLRDFLHKNRIKVGNILAIPKCQDCSPYRNGKHCSLIGSKIMLYNEKVALEDRVFAIDNMLSKGYLNANKAKECKELEQKSYLQGLRLALRADSKLQEKNKTADISNRGNAFIRSSGSFADRENIVLKTRMVLEEGIPVTQVRKRISTFRLDSDQIIQDAVAGMETVNAKVLDDCISKKYLFTGAGRKITFLKAEKCNKCTWNIIYDGDIIGCKKQSSIFSTMSPNFNENSIECKESQEIHLFFSGSEMVIDIDSSNNKSLLDVKMTNLGKDMPVDPGAKQQFNDTIIDLDEYANNRDIDIDLETKSKGVPPLNIKYLSGAAGLDLNDLL